MVVETVRLSYAKGFACSKAHALSAAGDGLKHKSNYDWSWRRMELLCSVNLSAHVFYSSRGQLQNGQSYKWGACADSNMNLLSGGSSCFPWSGRMMLSRRNNGACPSFSTSLLLGWIFNVNPDREQAEIVYSVLRCQALMLVPKIKWQQIGALRIFIVLCIRVIIRYKIFLFPVMTVPLSICLASVLAVL